MSDSIVILHIYAIVYGYSSRCVIILHWIYYVVAYVYVHYLSTIYVINVTVIIITTAMYSVIYFLDWVLAVVW